VLTTMGLFALSFVTRKIYLEFEWGIYRQLRSADWSLWRRYLIYEVRQCVETVVGSLRRTLIPDLKTYMALAHLCFFFAFGFWMQLFPLAVIVLAFRKHSRELNPKSIQLIVRAFFGFVLVFVQQPLASWSARRESFIGQCATLTALASSICLIIWALTEDFLAGGELITFTAEGALGHSTAYGAILLVILILTFVFAILCLTNFGKGLKQHIWYHVIGDVGSSAQRESDDTGRSRLRMPLE
jgi:hypothetical protein